MPHTSVDTYSYQLTTFLQACFCIQLFPEVLGVKFPRQEYHRQCFVGCNLKRESSRKYIHQRKMCTAILFGVQTGNFKVLRNIVKCYNFERIRSRVSQKCWGNILTRWGEYELGQNFSSLPESVGFQFKFCISISINHIIKMVDFRA